MSRGLGLFNLYPDIVGIDQRESDRSVEEMKC